MINKDLTEIEKIVLQNFSEQSDYLWFNLRFRTRRALFKLSKKNSKYSIRTNFRSFRFEPYWLFSLRLSSICSDIELISNLTNQKIKPTKGKSIFK